MANTVIKNGNTLKVTKSNGDVIWLPNAKFGGLKVTLNDVDGESTGRNQKGVMFRDRIRGGASAVRTVDVTFPPLLGAELSLTLHALEESTFLLEYPDPLDGARREATFYVGDRTMPVYTTSFDEDVLWTSMSVTFIER